MGKGMRVVSVVGARPQFVKLAPLAAELRDKRNIEHVIVHTGQHYDPNMSDVFFQELNLPTPDVNLRVGSGSHGAQTAAMLEALEPTLAHLAPDWTVVFGDTNSTLAAVLAAVKQDLSVAHVEAGLRSRNRRMPEEHNRILTDHAADLLLAPTKTAMKHLENEGLSERATLVGDIMVDVCLGVRASVEATPPKRPAELAAAGPYVVATVHRPQNTDDRARLIDVLTGLRSVECRVLLVAHPRLLSCCRRFEIELSSFDVELIEPLGYRDMIATTSSAVGVITDSGGLQKEAFLLGVPCTTLRAETEWPETLIDGWNVLHADALGIADAAIRNPPAEGRSRPFGDGRAAKRIVAALSDSRGMRA